MIGNVISYFAFTEHVISSTSDAAFSALYNTACPLDLSYY